MNVTEVMHLARALGVRLYLDDAGRLRAGPKERVTPELRRGIRENLEDLRLHIATEGLTPDEQTALDRLTASGGLDRETALEMILQARQVPEGVEAQSKRLMPPVLMEPGTKLTDEEFLRAVELEDREGIPFWESRRRVLAERGAPERRSA